MIIKNFYFRDFNNEHVRIKYIEINDGVDFRKILSFGFYRRPEGNDPNPNPNPYGINEKLNIHNWEAGWHFGVNYRLRCEKSGTIFPINVEYANLVAPGFMANDWKIIPNYFNGPADRGVDFFKSLAVKIKLKGEFQDEFDYWKKEQIAALVGEVIHPQAGNYRPADLAAVIGQAKKLL